MRVLTSSSAWLNSVYNSAVYRQQRILTICGFLLLSTCTKRCVWFHVFKDFNYNIFEAFCSSLSDIAKEYWIFVHPPSKYKTLVLFCFREYNFHCWKRAAVFVIKWNMFNMQGNFILVTDNANSCEVSWAASFTCPI